MAWPYSKRTHISTLLSKHSFNGCFCLHLEKNIDNALLDLAYFCFTCKTFNCDDRELIIYVLKFLNKLSISSRVAPPFVGF